MDAIVQGLFAAITAGDVFAFLYWFFALLGAIEA